MEGTTATVQSNPGQHFVGYDDLLKAISLRSQSTCFSLILLRLESLLASRVITGIRFSFEPLELEVLTYIK